MLEISATKGVEYANDEADANANFKEIGKKLGIDPKMVLWIYATKHHQAITAYLKNGKVLSEPINGRIHDLALYCMVLLSLIQDEYEHNFHEREA